MVYNKRVNKKRGKGSDSMGEWPKNKWVIAVLAVGASLVLLLFLMILIVNWLVMGRAKDYIVEADKAAALNADFDCILVLGAGVRADGSPSDMLTDRLKVGLELYSAGASDRILMSGDHMSANYDEVGAMKKFAIDAGVPSNVIFLDHAGLSTYESMWRAKELYGAENILIVTQGYHLYRAVYIARALGMNAYGVSADLRTYRTQLLQDVRESVARVKDFLYVLAKPEPTYLGEKVDLTGDGDSTNVNLLLPQED